jgi:hypothetical protein
MSIVISASLLGYLIRICPDQFFTVCHNLLPALFVPGWAIGKGVEIYI